MKVSDIKQMIFERMKEHSAVADAFAELYDDIEDCENDCAAENQQDSNNDAHWKNLEGILAKEGYVFKRIA